MARTIQELMTPNPTTISGSTTLVEAARLMQSEDTGSLPVVDGERLVAMLTDRDIVVRAIADGRDPKSTTADEIASTTLVTIDPRQSLEEGARMMAKHRIRRLPVVEDDGRLVGIVAQADLAREATDSLTGGVVGRISE